MNKRATQEVTVENLKTKMERCWGKNNNKVVKICATKRYLKAEPKTFKLYKGIGDLQYLSNLLYFTIQILRTLYF